MSTWVGRFGLRFFFSAVVAVAGCGILVPDKAAASAAPSISTQPQSQSVVAGSNAVFTVEASGQGTLDYQWSLNGIRLTDNAHITGATNATLTISNVVASDAGNYQVMVSNSHGSVTSSNATLTVLVPAGITAQPVSQAVLLSSNTAFTVSITGTTPLSCQWYFNGTPLTDGGRVSGAGTTNLNLANVQTNDAGSYQLVVTNNYGSATSVVATLTVLLLPSIVTSPTNQRVLEGGSVSFSVTATGTEPLYYQWQAGGIDLTNGNRISGATNPTLTISDLQFSDSGQYRVVVTNAYGTATSVAATLSVATNLPPLSNSIGVWGDYDNDGLMDVLLAGDVQGVTNIPDGRFTRLYHNAGGGIFDDSGVVLPQLDHVSAAWGDFDNDGDLDLLLSGLAEGTNGPVSVTEVYRNDGSNHFARLNLGLEPVAEGSVAWVDYDNDGRLDIFETGYDTTTSNWVTRLYHNNGDGTFTLAVTNLPAFPNDRGYWGDYDNDGYVDLMLTSPGTTYLLHNDGDGNFSNSGLTIPAQNVVVSPWGDYDGDGRLDFITSSATIPSLGQDYHPTLYHNEGNGVFSTQVDSSLNMWADAAAWGDIDNSGRACVLINGLVPIMQGVWGFALNAYMNVGGTWQGVLGLGGRTDGSATWVDYDGDGALDVFYTGEQFTGFWHNNVATHRDFPQPPLNPTVTFAALDAVTLSWQSPSNTPATGRGLSYNVRVGRTPRGVDVVSPMADPATGRRLVPALGNAGTAHLFILTNLPPGNYYWGVQSIGQSYTGSPFTTEGMFVVTSSPPVIVSEPTNLTVPWSSNTTFTVTVIGTKPLAYQWRKDGNALSDDTHYGGSTTPSLAITNVQAGDAGAYSAVITNDYGAITSSVATLTIVFPLPVITTQPANAGAFLGQSASFAVSATSSTPLSYQWLFNGIPLSDSDRLSGSESNRLTIQNVQAGDFGRYQVAVSNVWGSVTSTVASLTIATTRYVNVDNPSPSPPYTNWVSAATAIQDAIDVANVGDVIIVTNGVYATGGRTVNGYALTNRVVIDKAVTVESVNGPSFTTIQGFSSPSYFSNCVRGVYLTNGAVLVGITVSNGSTFGVSWPTATPENSGGGIWCESTSSVISNCVLVNNSAFIAGNGVWGGTLYNCALSSNNSGAIDGGAAVNSTLYTCMLVGNSAQIGGGAENCTLYTCTLVGNSAQAGGGAASCMLNNCTIATNSATSGGGGVFGGTVNNCTLTANTASENGGGAMDDAASHCTLNNCILTGNSVSVASGGNLPAQGGGAYLCTLNNCVLSNNQVINPVQDTRQTLGGGAFGGVLNNCVLIGNTANWYYGGGGGACNAVLINCTVVGNSTYNYSAGASGGGTLNCTVSNSIVYFNGFSQVSGANYAGGILNYCCTSPLPTGTGNVSTDPLFVNQSANDFHLQPNSPCINSGNNDCVTSTTDLDGNPRIVGGTVDIGAYEYQVPLYFLLSPTNQNVLVGSNFVLSASAVGDQPAYQWWFNGTPLANGGRIAGSRSNSLTVSLSQTNDTGNYWVTASNIAGVVTSAVAVVTVLQQPVIITAQPTDKMVLVGSNATFTVTASGVVPPNYLWYSNGVALTNGGRISGVTSPTLTISGAQTNDGAAYQVVVTNSYGAVTSQVATLTVLAPVQITGQPASEAILLGSNAMFSVAAAGSGPLNYQWYFNGMPLVDNSHISGSATPTLSVINVQSSDAGGYVAVVSNLLSSETSLTASLTPQANLSPSVRYVALTSTNPTPPYLNWSTAATNIQDAIDAAVAGDLVLVSNGVYQTGGRTVYGATSNRIVIDKAVAVQSVNGPAVTSIVGIYNPAAAHPYGRCAYLTNNASLTGFTLTNGFAETSGDVILEESGGGVWCESSSAVISNCVLTGNRVTQYGGGAFGGTLLNCLLTNNYAAYGGGAASNALVNCTLAQNSSFYRNLNYGGGAYGCSLSNCLLVGNQAIGGGYGGGAAFSVITSCTISNNSAASGGGVFMGAVNYTLISSNRASVYGGGACSNVLNNCTITNNSGEFGGATAYSTLKHCIISGNYASNAGGASYQGIADNCLFTGNFAESSGTAAYGGMLRNCTVAGNLTPVTGGIAAVNAGSVMNCIVYDNAGGNIVNSENIAYTCTVPVVAFPGNITNAPLFVNEAGGDFHLSSNSPCINSGNNAYVTATNDFDGNPRIVGGTVDMGAYEFQSPSSVLSYAWAQHYGLPTDGSVDYADLDGTGFNVYQDWIAGLNPTNVLSVLAMLPPVPTSNPAGMVVSWESVSNRTYFLQSSTNLGVQPVFSTIQSNIVGQPDVTRFMDTNAIGNGPYFYRVGVQ